MNNLYYNDRKLKKIKKKRTQKTKKVWGWILTILGALMLPSLIMDFAGVEDIIMSLMFLVPGILLVMSSKRQVERWDRYEAIIDNRGNTPISLIARKMGLSEQRVYSDLQTMIHSDFFIGPNYNIEAYIDAERNMLVMASGGQPLRPLPDLDETDAKAGAYRTGQSAERSDAGDGARAFGRAAEAFGRRAAEAFRRRDEGGSYEGADGWDYAEAAAAGGTAAGRTPGDVPDADYEAADDVNWQEELTELDLIRQAIAEAKDDEVRNYLYGLEGSVRRIGEQLEARPELKEKLSVKRLYKYYLPQIMELIRQYRAPDTPADLKAKIKDALRTSADALSNIEADLLEKKQMDAEVDIEVLKNMFAQDGLLRGGSQQGRAGGGAPRPQGQPAPQAQPAAQPGAAPRPTPQPAAQPGAAPRPTPQPSAQPAAAPRPTPQPAPQPQPGATPRPTPEPAPQQGAAPQPTPQPGGAPNQPAPPRPQTGGR